MKKHPDLLFSFALELLSAFLLILVFPNLIFAESGQTWLAPLALTPLLIALAREHRRLGRFLLGEFAGIVYWFGVCSWIQFVLEYHGGMGRWGGWAVFLLFSVAKALHMAVFNLLAGVVVNKSYAIPAVAALWTGIERTHGNFGFAWLALGNAGIDMPLPARVAPFLGVYGISFVFALTAASVMTIILRRGRRQLLWLATVPALLLLPDLPAPHSPTEKAVVLQPNMAEDAQWTLTSAGQARDRLIDLSLEAAVHAEPQIIIWPEVPGPLYYYRDRRFHQEAPDLPPFPHPNSLFGPVPVPKTGAPLNSPLFLR